MKSYREHKTGRHIQFFKHKNHHCLVNRYYRINRCEPLSSNNLKRDLKTPFNVRFASSLKIIHSVSDVYFRREKRVTNSTAKFIKRAALSRPACWQQCAGSRHRHPATTTIGRPADPAHRLRGMYPTVDTAAAVFARDVWQHSSPVPAWKSKRRRRRHSIARYVPL